jgi:hypothetical protein
MRARQRQTTLGMLVKAISSSPTSDPASVTPLPSYPSPRAALSDLGFISLQNRLLRGLNRLSQGYFLTFCLVYRGVVRYSGPLPSYWWVALVLAEGDRYLERRN